MRLLAAWLTFACAGGQSLPKIGELLDTAGSMRPVFGVAGNFLVGAADTAKVISAACSDKFCLAKTDSKILSATGATGAPPGPAVFALEDATAVVYFRHTGTFARWNNNALVPLHWTVHGEVLSILANRIAVRRGGAVWIMTPEGAALDAIPAPSGPLLMLAGGLLFTTSGQIVLRKPDASELRFDLTDVETLSPLSTHYVEIRAGSALYALRVDPGHEQLFQLPGSQP